MKFQPVNVGIFLWCMRSFVYIGSLDEIERKIAFNSRIFLVQKWKLLYNECARMFIKHKIYIIYVYVCLGIFMTCDIGKQFNFSSIVNTVTANTSLFLFLLLFFHLFFLLGISWWIQRSRQNNHSIYFSFFFQQIRKSMNKISLKLERKSWCYLKYEKLASVTQK